MTKANVRNGDAFEYAGARSLSRHCENGQIVKIKENDHYQTKLNRFDELELETQQQLIYSADLVMGHVLSLEPRLTQPDYKGEPLAIMFNSPTAGRKGDPRDVIAYRPDGWEVGFCMKHNHNATKHPRISDRAEMSFGGTNSRRFRKALRPIFNQLRTYKADKVLWRELENKKTDVYEPALIATMKELQRRLRTPEAIEQFISLILSKKDYYRVKLSRGIVRLEAFNLYGSLGEGGRIKIPRLSWPSKVVEIEQVNTNRAEVVFDAGYHVSLRIHNASTKVEPSLKYDVQLVGQPSNMYSFCTVS